MSQYNNRIHTTFTHTDGRVFEAKLGKIEKFSYKRNGYDQLGFDVSYEWGGLHTSMFYGVEEETPELVGIFLLSVMGAVGNVGSDQIVGRQVYLLFTEKRHNIPVGLASVNGMHTAFIFDDFYAEE